MKTRPFWFQPVCGRRERARSRFHRWFCRIPGGGPTRALALIGFLLGAARLIAGPLQDRPTREVDMGSYVVISDAPDRVIRAWVKDFDVIRAAGQKLTGVKDDQLLPLTILLFNRRSEFEKVLPYRSRKAFAMTVGFDQQPVIALDIAGNADVKDHNLRFAVLSWMQGSSGLSYDLWIVQGLYDLFALAHIKSREIVIGQRNDRMIGYIKSDLEQRGHLPFELHDRKRAMGVDWLALHYLLINDHAWAGMSALMDYQRRVTLGESRDRAFASIFGLSPAQAITALDNYYHHGEIRPAYVPWERPDRPDQVKITAAEPGLRELSVARLLLQMAGADHDEAGRLIETAAKLRPWDVAIKECRFLQGIMTGQPGLAAESLNQAITLGSQNPTLRLLWCMDSLQHAMQRNNGFILAPDQAIKVADVLHALVEANANRVMGYMLLAQIVPSIQPARPQDRAMLEAGIKASPMANPLLLTGLAAWDWRHGDRPRARTQVESVLQERDLNSGAATFAQWLQAQIRADDLANQVKTSMEAGDYNEARRLLNGFSPRYALMPDVKEGINRLYRVAGEEELIAEAEQALVAGQPAQAGLLVRSLAVGELPADLQNRAKAVLAQAREKAPDSAGAGK